MVLSPCPLWGGGTASPQTGDYLEVENARAGGSYRITGTAAAILQNSYSTELASKLTTWIVDQHRFGEKIPVINSNVLNLVNGRQRLSISEQIQRFFLLLLHLRFRANSSLRLWGNASDGRHMTDISNLMAWLECENEDELNSITSLLLQDGFLKNIGVDVVLTLAGVNKLDQTRISVRESSQGFIAMWFDPSMQAAYDDGFERAIRAAGYTPMRIDKKEHNNKIDDEIIAEIKRSRFVVADFTCGTVSADSKTFAISRGGVYFEAGYAMALGIPVFWSCRKDLMGDVHFDTRQFAHIVWETPRDLGKQLYNRISAVIGELPGAPGLDG